MIELVFVRHGQTDWNLERRLQGIIDIPLNQAGIYEAEKISDFIPDNFHKIITSPLKRAYKTAEILNKKLNVVIDTDKRIVERDFGKLAGEEACFVKSMENIDTMYNVESISDFTNKLLLFLEDCSKLQNGRYLVVTHGGVIITLLSHLSHGEINWENTPIKNCTLTGLSFDDKWSIDFFNLERLENNLINSVALI